MTFAHVGGLPVEETLAMGGPALFTALGALAAQLRARRTRRRRADRQRRIAAHTSAMKRPCTGSRA
jgi:hypothetical protein